VDTRPAGAWKARPGVRAVAGVVEIRSVDVLSEGDVWSQLGPTIWRADRFAGSPHFYPIYRYGSLYSFSPLALILQKGSVRVDEAVLQWIRSSRFTYEDASRFIDRDISRVGGPLDRSPEIRCERRMIDELAEAIRRDVAEIERSHPGHLNVVLCGGKDSLNLLLLPWRNPVIAFSARPNLELVKRFVRENGLPIDVHELRDDKEPDLAREILINCGRNDLAHFRWGGHLRAIAEERSRKVLFWKGQLGSVLMTGKWRTYTHASPRAEERIFRWRAARAARGKVRRLMSDDWLQRQAFAAMWRRGAMMQGTHLGFLRELTRALFLSAYHGPAVREVFVRADLSRTLRTDIRPLVGAKLAGGDVWYPPTNPTPPVSSARKGVSGSEPFLGLLEAKGVEIG